MPSFPDIELHRDGVALLPPRDGSQRGGAIWLQLKGHAQPMRSCTCGRCKGGRTCDSLKQLTEEVRRYQATFGKRGWQRSLEQSIWYRLASLLHAGAAVPCASVRVQELSAIDEAGSSAIRCLDPKGRELATYLDTSPHRLTFLERCGKVPKQKAFVDRAALLERLALFQLSDQERKLEKLGARSRRRDFEDSFWHRLAYHCVRAWGLDPAADETPGTQTTGHSFHPAVDRDSGDFTLTYRVDARPIVRLTVPRSRVEPILELLAAAFPDQPDLALHPVPLETLFLIQPDTELDLRVRPVIRLLQQSGEATYLDRERLEKYRYGRLLWVRELGVLARIDRDRSRRFVAPKSVRLQRAQVPGFLADHKDDLQAGRLVLDQPLGGLEVLTSYDALEIDSDGDLDDSGRWWLGINYCFGERQVPLRDLLAARRKDLPFLDLGDAWVDLQAPAMRDLDRLVERGLEATADSTADIGLTVGEVLRLQAGADGPVELTSDRRNSILQRLLDHQPSTGYQAPAGFKSELRTYQAHGVDWLRFLADHQLGGLLCDDMGLGKTHQAMALMACLHEADPAGPPFLVVCPTSVISHWRDKLRRFAPALPVAIYHGSDRRLRLQGKARTKVVVTSYGLLRNDLDKIGEVPWRAFFIDEIQHLKNRSTKAYDAARRLHVPLKVGLTGTPIENTLGELKNLFDLVLPGYLGSDRDFHQRYDRALIQEGTGMRENRARLAELRNLISPFILRRRKQAVLDELPAKIEDVRTCTLSEEQQMLYREAIEQRAKPLVDTLRDSSQRTPYLHVFALLSYLKRVCDHPALALGDPSRFEQHSSNKWNLFCEILSECMDAGEKVVVFSQYLGMLEIMARHLQATGIDHVRLTGSVPAAERGPLIERFNEDPECRVFLGSLQAGGTGIDLIGGSVVVHYDRWWTAAREDQATDRVHRLGQKRVVQVFKLVTEGTLEERIAEVIENKRDLLDQVVQEDDAKLAKIFSRDQLLDMLRPL